MILGEFICIKYNILLVFSVLPSVPLILLLLGFGLLVFTQPVQPNFLLSP